MPDRQVLLLQIAQEALRFVDARKIGNQAFRFHLSKIIIFPEFPFNLATNQHS